MNLFGLKLPVFVVQFKRLFCIEYDSGIIRIRDKVTKTSLVNCKLPLLISDDEQDIMTSLYICIFKYECQYECKYSKKLYKRVKQVLESFINDVIPYRKNLQHLVQECLLDAVHHKYHGVEYNVNNYKMDQLCRESEIQNDLDTFAVCGYHQALIYVNT